LWSVVVTQLTQPGQKQVVYHGQCAELCGRNHANMVGNVIGMRYADWKRWYDQQARDLQQAQRDAASERAKVNATGNP
jgi:cytochrome c oxidase subunit 2